MPTVDIEKVRKLRLGPSGDQPSSTLPGDSSGSRRNRSKWPILVAGLLVLAGVALVWVLRSQPPASVPPRPTPAAVATAPTVEAIHSTSAPSGAFTAAGYIEPMPPFPVGVTPLVSGRIDSFESVEGSVVREGDVIAKLDGSVWERQAAELRATLEVNHARVAQSEKAFQRAERLAGIGSTSTRDLEQARSDLAVLRAEANRLAEQLKTVTWHLDNTVLRAPVSGVLFERLAHVGDFVGPEGKSRDTTAIATIYDPEKVQVWVDVNQRDAARLAVGQPVEVSLDAEPGKTYRGRVLRVLPRASLSKNTVQAKIRLDEPSASLRPDMSVKVSFQPVAGQPAQTR